jgi:uncharacterized membrane protein YdbT with pleckstrin-like domain
MRRVAGVADLTEGERMVVKLRRHWKTIIWPILILAAILVATLALLLLVGPLEHPMARLIVGVVAILAVLIFVARPLLRWWTTSYELTTRRLRLRAGVIARRGRDFPLSRISDVSFAQGPLDRLLGCGRLIVESPGEHGQLTLTEIPHVKRVQATLFQLVEDERERLATEQQ